MRVLASAVLRKFRAFGPFKETAEHVLNTSASGVRVLCLFGIIFVAAGFNSEAADEIEIAGKSSGSIQSIMLRVGETKLVSLERQGGTGYFWERSSLNQGIVQVRFLRSRRAGQPGQPGFLGGAEFDVFAVQGISSGSTNLTFELQKLREPPIRSVTVGLIVKE